MPATRATMVQQRQEMAHLTDQGESCRATASQVGVSFWTARKWIRRARRGGLAALVTALGRPVTGPMAGFDPLVRYVALRLKRQYKTWGAEYVVKKMGERPALKGKKLPSPTTVWRYWRTFLPVGRQVATACSPGVGRRNPNGHRRVWRTECGRWTPKSLSPSPESAR